MGLEMFYGLPSKAKTLLDRLSTTRAGYLDNLTNLDAPLSGITAQTMKETILTSSGSWSVPSALKGDTVYATLVGGGGGGAASNAASGDYVGGGGGGGGATILNCPYTVTPSGSVSYSVGSAGSGGASERASGSAGNDTTFGNLTAGGGGGGKATTNDAEGGAGGAAPGMDVYTNNAGGQEGADGDTIATEDCNGLFIPGAPGGAAESTSGGGGSADWERIGGGCGNFPGGGADMSGSTAYPPGAGGGASYFGPGGDGGSNGTSASAGSAPASGYGGGGGGGGSGYYLTDNWKAGGNGRVGTIILRWFE